MWKKKNNETHEEFMKNNFTRCSYCGYNNKNELFMRFGTCLRCHKILDNKTYFRNRLGIERRKKRYSEG